MKPRLLDLFSGAGGAAMGYSRAGFEVVGVYGGSHFKGDNIAYRSAAMGIDWMTLPELSQAIPPSFTEYIGAQLLQHIQSERAA